MGTFDSLFGNENSQRAQEATLMGLNWGYKNANKALDTGLSNATGYYDKSLAETDPLKATYGSGATMYANAMGLNGAAGNQAAADAFQAGPGYQYNLDQTLQALGRSAAAAGRLNSGNTSLDFMRAASGLADQAWQNWTQGLQGYNALASNTAQNRSNTLESLGQLNYGTGDSKADLAWSMGQGIAQAGADAANSRNQGLGKLIDSGIGLASGTKLFRGF